MKKIILLLFLFLFILEVRAQTGLDSLWFVWEDKKKADFSMLYNLDEDPNEFNNLVENPAYSTIINELKLKLDSAIVN